jgi:hypothetical protein
VRRTHIVGHTYGGPIALQLAPGRPDLPSIARALVLRESALRVRSGGPTSQELSKRMALAMQSYPENDSAGTVNNQADRSFRARLQPTIGPESFWGMGSRQCATQMCSSTSRSPNCNDGGSARRKQGALPVPSMVGRR